jgi:hypothetical protein
MIDMSDIPGLPDRDERFAEIMVDCYGQDEELSAMEVYLQEAPAYPFAAIWRDPDEADHAEAVTVLGVNTVDDRRGILLNVDRRGKTRRVAAEQLWAKDEHSATAVVLDDYRHWITALNGLTPGFA